MKFYTHRALKKQTGFVACVEEIEPKIIEMENGYFAVQGECSLITGLTKKSAQKIWQQEIDNLMHDRRITLSYDTAMRRAKKMCDLRTQKKYVFSGPRHNRKEFKRLTDEILNA